MRSLHLLATVVTMIGIVTTQEIVPEQMSYSNAAEIVSGVLYGILEDEIPAGALDHCIGDGEALELQVATAVRDLESLTFEGIKKGLQEAGAAVKLIPGMVKDCVEVKGELSIILKMASIFEHPLSLIYHVGKALIVNGSDILSKIQASIEAYKAYHYFAFGTYLGEALDEVFMKTMQYSNGVEPELKHRYDEKAYSFLTGFFSGIDGLQVDSESLYNGIDGKGAMLVGPVEAALKTLN